MGEVAGNSEVGDSRSAERIRAAIRQAVSRRPASTRSPGAGLRAGRYIVYACPVGELADQVADYFEAARAIFPENPACAYPPHCSLTGFFEDGPMMVSAHLCALDELCRTGLAEWPEPTVRVTSLHLDERFHGLILESSWLRRLVEVYAMTMAAPPFERTLRIKDWLHLSLAYGFPTELDAPLRQLAERTVDPQASAQWELRFYERLPDESWMCHRSCTLLSESGNASDQRYAAQLQAGSEPHSTRTGDKGRAPVKTSADPSPSPPCAHSPREQRSP